MKQAIEKSFHSRGDLLWRVLYGNYNQKIKHMKKILSILMGVILIGLSACDDELYQAPIDNQNADSFYQNEEQFEQAINGMYNALLTFSTHQFYLSEIRSDNVFAPGTGVRLWNPINNFDNTLETNDYIEDCWNDYFRGIYLANSILDKISSSIISDEDTYNRMIGEAKFIRGFLYFEAIKTFGKVPLMDHVVNPSDALVLDRSDVADVYELVISDLQFAASNLEDSYSVAGKATSWAAKAMLARVYLTQSGPDYGINGPGLGLNKYSDALTLLNDIINNGPYSWVDDYASIFSYTNENNGDIIFDLQAIDTGSTSSSGVGTILPTLMYLESWAKINLPFAGGVPNDGSGCDPSDALIASFEDGDVRDDFSILMSYVDENNNPVDNPQYIKFLDVTYAPAIRFNWPINFPVIRYTDVLMMKAEALIQTNGSQTEIDAIVNKVRERAGVDPVSDVDLDMLLAERQKEFMAEGLRWHDLVRTGKVLDVMNAWIAEEDDGDNVSTVVANYIIYPVPYSQMEVKQDLYTQNPGY